MCIEVDIEYISLIYDMWEESVFDMRCYEGSKDCVGDETYFGKGCFKELTWLGFLPGMVQDLAVFPFRCRNNILTAPSFESFGVLGDL